MRLADFILANVEPILEAWETFARSLPVGTAMTELALRDHAEEILRATAADMVSAQSKGEQAAKSKGEGLSENDDAPLNGASDIHAVGRVDSGFNMVQVVSEYRALRASVIRLWRQSGPAPDLRDLEDITRFNESIDQSLTKAVRSYTERVDRSRKLFLAILGHDLRNPLGAILMGAGALSRWPGLDADAAETAAGLSSSAQAMANMIDDLLDFTSGGLGMAMPVSPAPADLGAICREVVDEMRTAYPDRTLHFEPSGDLAGEWDANRLRQMVSNLVGNALEHGVADGPVDLAAAGAGAQVVLTVHNGGAPIAPEALATIFDPLVRGSPELRRHRRPGSIGLGLYIARAVADAHGGSIAISSTAAAGTTFTVRLPRRRPPASAPAGPAAS